MSANMRSNFKRYRTYRLGGLSIIVDELGYIISWFIGSRLIVIEISTTVLKK